MCTAILLVAFEETRRRHQDVLNMIKVKCKLKHNIVIRTDLFFKRINTITYVVFLHRLLTDFKIEKNQTCYLFSLFCDVLVYDCHYFFVKT